MDIGPGIIGQFVSDELIGISFFVEIETLGVHRLKNVLSNDACLAVVAATGIAP
jgi:hypothetical protein